MEQRYTVDVMWALEIQHRLQGTQRKRWIFSMKGVASILCSQMSKLSSFLFIVVVKNGQWPCFCFFLSNTVYFFPLVYPCIFILTWKQKVLLSYVSTSLLWNNHVPQFLGRLKYIDKISPQLIQNMCGYQTISRFFSRKKIMKPKHKQILVRNIDIIWFFLCCNHTKALSYVLCKTIYLFSILLFSPGFTFQKL